MLEALICSGIHLNGLVETYIIFDDLFCRITLEVFLIIFRYFLIRIRTGTCKIMLRSQITFDPMILLVGHTDLAFVLARSGRIVLAGHQLFITVLTKQDLTGIRYIDQCIIILCCHRIRIRGRGDRLEHLGIPCRHILFIGTVCIFLPERNRRFRIHISAVIISQPDTIHIYGAD